MKSIFSLHVIASKNLKTKSKANKYQSSQLNTLFNHHFYTPIISLKTTQHEIFYIPRDIKRTPREDQLPRQAITGKNNKGKVV